MELPFATEREMTRVRLPAHEPAAFAAQSALLSRHIRALLPAGAHVLVAGLGNEAVTPDAVGPEALRNLIVTRHLKRTMPEVFAPFSTVSAIAPGVLGTTGMESAELLAAAVRQIQPDAVIAVDAVASCSTIPPPSAATLWSVPWRRCMNTSRRSS